MEVLLFAENVRGVKVYWVRLKYSTIRNSCRLKTSADRRLSWENNLRVRKSRGAVGSEVFVTGNICRVSESFRSQLEVFRLGKVG